jgi:hypothetical protein
MSLQIHTLTALTREAWQVPTEWVAGMASEPVKIFGEEKNLLLLLALEATTLQSSP